MHAGWVNASRAEKINQIKHLDDVLQANVVLNEGLARATESEVSASFTRAHSWGISRIASNAEQDSVEKRCRRVDDGNSPERKITGQRLMG
jgi:hypothetical protein